MGDQERPWEPPLAGTEAEHLTGALDRLRTTFRWKADDLDAAQLRTAFGRSGLTMAGLLKHLARVEAECFDRRVSGRAPGEPWSGVDWEADPDWDFVSALRDRPADLYALWDRAAERSRGLLAAALDEGGLDQVVALAVEVGEPVSLRRVLCDLIEEYGRHTGHADLVREALDGRVGEDPPAGWRPRPGTTPGHGLVSGR